MNSSLRAVLFDIDGTLTDSAPLIRTTLAYVMREKSGLDLPESSYSRFVGPPLEDTFVELDVPASEVSSYIDKYREYYDVYMDDTPLFPGVADMLTAVRDSGLRSATATSKLRRSAKHVCEVTGIASSFDIICGSEPELGRTHKHHVVGTAITELEQLGILDGQDRLPEMPLGTEWFDRPVRTDVVMVGDRNFDTYGAAVHGIRTILVDWGEGDDAEKKHAWRHVSTVEELTRLLTSL
ncbi:HAD hydrolase-like protein [Arcanobacterium phocae]|uniref:HAD hydrolase-like protein n=1 Tax=Arcanobacterium phocae TaxID=131112 RepID=UPI001C0ED701|nr:HAD hydrolase-like protein [Arcanobacterium phocae]